MMKNKTILLLALCLSNSVVFTSDESMNIKVDQSQFDTNTRLNHRVTELAKLNHQFAAQVESSGHEIAKLKEENKALKDQVAQLSVISQGASQDVVGSLVQNLLREKNTVAQLRRQLHVDDQSLKKTVLNAARDAANKRMLEKEQIASRSKHRKIKQEQLVHEVDEFGSSKRICLERVSSPATSSRSTHGSSSCLLGWSQHLLENSGLQTCPQVVVSSENVGSSISVGQRSRSNSLGNVSIGSTDSFDSSFFE